MDSVRDLVPSYRTADDCLFRRWGLSNRMGSATLPKTVRLRSSRHIMGSLISGNNTLYPHFHEGTVIVTVAKDYLLEYFDTPPTRG